MKFHLHLLLASLLLQNGVFGATLIVNQVVSQSTNSSLPESIFNFVAPISSGPVTITVGDTVVLNFNFGEGKHFRWATHEEAGTSVKFNLVASLFEQNPTRSLGAYQITNRTVTLIGNTGPFTQNPLTGGPFPQPNSGGANSLRSSFFADRRNGANPIIFDGVRTFSDIQFSFDLDEFAEDSHTFDGIFLGISVDQGSAQIVPEPSILSLLGLSWLFCSRLIRQRKQ